MSKPSFLQFMQERDQLDEAFNSAPYELTMGKKNAGDVFFTFIDEDEKEFRIQFYTPQGLGKNVRQVFIGQKRGSTYPDAIARFKNPMRVIASMIEATKQFLATPLGKTIDGYAVNFSKKALDRGMTLIPKIIRQSGLKQKLNVMDLTYAPVPDRGYVWLVKKGKDPAVVFDGPKMQGITWDDPDKIGDVPVQNTANSSPSGTEQWKMSFTGPRNDQPILTWYKGNLTNGESAEILALANGYSGSSGRNAAEGGDVAEITRKLNLPVVPNDVLAKFTAAASSWRNSKNARPTIQQMTSRDLDAHPFRRKVLENINKAIQAEGIGKPGSSKGFYLFSNNESFRVFFEKVVGDDVNGLKFSGSVASKDGVRQIQTDFDVDAATDAFMKTIRAMQPVVNVRDNGWSLSGKPGQQPEMIYFANGKSGSITAHVSKPGTYAGNFNGATGSADSAMYVIRSLGMPEPPTKIYNEFTKMAKAFWNKPVAFNGQSTVGAKSVEELRSSGFIAQVLGIIDTNIDSVTSVLPGENIRRSGAGRYTTAGGTVIIVSFNDMKSDFVQYEVYSEIYSTKSVTTGTAREVADAIMRTMFDVATNQYIGEWEINAVPMSAPYPITRVSHSKGWGYVETANWTLKISDALLNRVKPGKTARLTLNKEPLRGKHLLEIIPENRDETLMLKDRSGTIYGSIDLNAEGGEIINSKTLNMPRNSMVFGETVNGMSIMWSNITFPKSGKYDGAKLNTNVTYYYDKGKVAFTPMVIQNGRTLNNPKTYEVSMNKATVQAIIDEISSRMDLVTRHMQTLTSTNYNPNQVFLDDIQVTDGGKVLWRGHDMGDRRTGEFMLGVLGDENRRLEKEPGTAKKTGVELAAYAGSIRDSAPSSRDVDWQVYASKDGQTLNVDWDITFRRNSRVGAMREFKAQIDRANNYLQTVYADAKKKGYNLTEPRLMTMADAQRSDDIAEQNEGSAYSEYEQAIGGNLQIKI